MSELQTLLTEFAAERLALLERHEASARIVSNYDFNNTYQYVISREETHLSWLQSALAEYGAMLPAAGSSSLPAPAAPRVTKKVEAGAFRSILDDEARYLGAVAAYRDLNNSKWKALSPAPETGLLDFVRKHKLIVTVGKSEVKIGPAN